MLKSFPTKSLETWCKYHKFDFKDPQKLRMHVAREHADSIRAFMYHEELKALNKEAKNAGDNLPSSRKAL